MAEPPHTAEDDKAALAQLMQFAVQFDDKVQRYLDQHPTAVALVLQLAMFDADDAVVAQITRFVLQLAGRHPGRLRVRGPAACRTQARRGRGPARQRARADRPTAWRR